MPSGTGSKFASNMADLATIKKAIRCSQASRPGIWATKKAAKQADCRSQQIMTEITGQHVRYYLQLEVASPGILDELLAYRTGPESEKALSFNRKRGF